MHRVRKGIFFLLLFVFEAAFAQIPPGYYNSANGLTGTTLQQALHNIIGNHTVVSYDALWTWFKQTDKKANGKVWDMYSDIPGGTPPYEYTFVTNQCGTYNSEADCYNREHSWPKSWFSDKSPMISDIFHIYPTDGYVNNKRDNYAYGKVGTPTWTSMNGSKLGNCVSPGYTGTVFEPVDDYKGDFARSYFYMETRYYNEDTGWQGGPMSTGSQLLPWAQTLMMLWNLQDPVSQKEINRNDSIYKNIQHNRNPFIDHPEYAALIWAQYMPQPGTYTWNVTSGNWSSAGSWSPVRTVAIPGDILVFNGSVTPNASVNVDFSSPQSVARLRIINNSTVTFTESSAARMISIGSTGASSPQFEVSAGSSLSITSSNPVTLSFLSGFTGIVGGNINFQNSSHQIVAGDAGALTFASGSTFTAGNGFIGSPFGTTGLNSVVFAGGSVYSLEAGLSPFGAVSPASVVVFQLGSLYKHKTNSQPSLPGRTYSNFEIDAASFNQSITAGTSPCTFNNLTITNSQLAGFDFPGGCIVKGNIQVNAGTLRFDPASGTLTFNATGNQTIGGAGSLIIGSNCDVIIGANSSTVANKNLVFGKKIQFLPGGSFTISPGIIVMVNGEVVIN